MFHRSIIASAVIGLWIAGCSAEENLSATSATAPATAAEAGTARGHWVPDPHQDGRAAAPRLTEVFWARLVDVYDYEPATGRSVRQNADVPIAADIASDGVNYELTQSHLDGRWKLTILHPARSDTYARLFAALDAWYRLDARVLDPGAPGSDSELSVVPRNAALVLCFDDLLDEGSVGSDSVQLLVDGHAQAGNEGLWPASVSVDASRGGISPLDGRFHSTRVVIDLAGNGSAGLPAARSASQANVQLRIATRVDAAVGQMRALTNVAGRSPASSDAAGSQGTMVVRAFRSASSDLADAHQGFLSDGEPPEVVGVQPVDLIKVRRVGPDLFLVAIAFVQRTCWRIPAAGDGLLLPSHTAEVIPNNVRPVATAGGAIVRRIYVQVIAGDPSTFAAGVAGQLQSSFRSASAEVPECFVGFSPAAGTHPNRDVEPSSSVSLRFSEPMDANSVSAFDSFQVLRPAGAAPLTENIVGRIASAPSLQSFDFVPDLPLTHVQGSSERYRVKLRDGASGVRDLSGNALLAGLPETSFFLDTSAADAATSGLSLVLDSADEDGNGAPELRGQFLYDLAAGVIHSRPVARFSAQADSTSPIVGAMFSFNFPLQAPLNPLGAKMMNVWRYADLGFSLTDEATMNVDVEGLWWSPLGSVLTDTFAELRMALAHANVLPDEVLNQGLLPTYPHSGVGPNYDMNLLDPLTVVHPKSSGYVVNPLDLTTSPSGNPLMPWPMNRGLQASQFTRYTWRDTALTAVGGANGGGVDLRRLSQVGVSGTQANLYAAGEVPSIGLPLLMEFRVYPDSMAFGLNGFKTNIAINSSARPNFRAFSSGAVIGGNPVLVDPDNDPVATGVPGLFVQPTDNTSYEGQADFVVRVSRLHSIWLDTGSATPAYGSLVLEPSAAGLPANTQIVAAVRGADLVTPGTGNPPAAADATRYDFYGDLRPQTGSMVGFHNGDPGWKSDPTQIDGARYVQLRISLIGDPVAGLTPALSAAGISFTTP